MKNKTLKAKRTTGINGNPVITIDHICGDDAEFSVDDLLSLAITLLHIAAEVRENKLGDRQTKEYPIGS